MTKRENNHILLVDDDAMICKTVQTYLERYGYQISVAHDGVSALIEIEKETPALAIVDLHMPHMNGIEFLHHVRSNKMNFPVIITTAEPEMDLVIDVIHEGAQDFIVKPFHLSDLAGKIEQILNSIRHHRKQELLSELIEIHSITNKLAASSDHEQILDVTFHSCLQAANSHHGYLMLADEDGSRLLLVRAEGEYHGAEITSTTMHSDWPEAVWVFKHNRTVTVLNGKCDIPELDSLSQRIDGMMIVAPLRAGDKVVGVICIEGLIGDHLYSQLGQSLLEILAAQAGNAIHNAGLYQKLNQRIADLNFISDYAEQFVGMVDPEEVLLSFLETIRDYFHVDYLGVLFLKKRFHTFLYWSSFEESSSVNDQVCCEAITCFNASSDHQITPQRVKKSPLPNHIDILKDAPEKLAFTRTVPLVWDKFEFGSLVLKWEKEPKQNKANEKLLTGIINQTRFALTNAKLYADIKENYLRTIKALAIAVDAKDAYTHGHSENVMRYAEIHAKHLSLSEETIERIRNGGLLHDIGKIGIPGYILNKPTKLSDEEFNGVMKTHPTLGANIIHDVPFLQELNNIILYHHENYDGSGYPLGLAGEEIPFDARIVHVADAYEAMTSNRPYRKSLGTCEAVRRLREGAGTQFDPVIVEQFIEAMIVAGEIDKEEIAA